MSILRRILNRKPGGDAGGDPLGPRFDAEFFRAVRRFAIVTGYSPENFTFNLRHPETQAPMAPHLGIAPYFDAWKKIRSPWDRVELFFRYFLESRGSESFDPWAVANVLSALRLPREALDMLQRYELSAPDSECYARHCGAFARAMIPLIRPQEALQWAQAAAAADPEDARLRLLLADALRLDGQCEEATTIYSSLMATAAPSPDDAPDPIADLFARLFSVETGAAPSPFFALDVVVSLEDTDQAAQFWQLGEAEFYDSPHFRMRQSYHMAATGQTREAFAKLAALVGEMPWLREAHLNLLQLFHHLDPAGDTLMPELRQQVEQRIQSEGWTAEGMQQIEIRPGVVDL